MKKVLVIILSIYPVIVFAQDSLTKKPTDTYKYNIGVFFQPTIDLGSGICYWYNYTIGLRTNIKISKRFSLNTGLGYGHEKYDLTKKLIQWEDDPDSFEAKTIKTDLNFRYDISCKNKKLKFYGIFGNELNFHFYERNKYFFSESVVKKLRFYNTLVAVGCGFEYSNKHISLKLEPTLNVPIWILTYWSRQNDYTGISRSASFPYFCRFGISTGFVYKWKKKE